MKLFLGQFRNHQELELEFPETGLVRIDGRSGAGKSSIFQAIHFCLNNKGRNVTTWNEKTSTVKLEGFGLNVERTKSPNTLTCNGVGSVTAQDEIQNILGMNPLEFEISSYISQGQRNSLINLSPAEQLELINALSFQSKAPEQHKEKIKSFIKETEQNLIEIKKQIEMCTVECHGTENVISSLKSVMTEPETSLDGALAEKAELEQQARDKQDEIEHLKKNCAEIEKSLAQKDRQNLDAAADFMKSAPARIDELEQECRKPENQELISDQTATSAEIQTLNQEVMALSKKHSRLKMSEKNAVDSDSLNSLVTAACEEINAIAGWGLDASSSEVSESFLKIKLSAEKGLSAAESLKLAISSDARAEIRSEIEQISQRMMEIYKKIEDISKEKEKITQHNAKVRTLRDQLAALKKRQEAAEHIIFQNSGRRSSKELELQSADFKNQLQILTPELAQVRSAISIAESCISAHAQRENTKRKIAEAEEKLGKKKEHRSLLEKTEHATEKMLAGSLRLESIWAKAALDVIEATISEINLRAAYWLDLLLEGKVSAELKTTKRIKSKDQIIDSINLQVMFKGQVLEKVSEELSGGQYSRVVLAYQLAIGDLYNSPILMLDEALKGCDAETVEACVEALKTASSRKLLLMIEHHVSDHEFDHVIRLQEA